MGSADLDKRESREVSESAQFLRWPGILRATGTKGGTGQIFVRVGAQARLWGSVPRGQRWRLHVAHIASRAEISKLSLVRAILVFLGDPTKQARGSVPR